MTTMYHLDLKQGEADSGTTRVLAALVTEDAETMAATLRAVADRLDPPQKTVYRRQDGPQLVRGLPATTGLRSFSDTPGPSPVPCLDCFGDRHTYEAGKCAMPPPWNGVMVDGDGKAPRDRPVPFEPVEGSMGFAVPVVNAPGSRTGVPDAPLADLRPGEVEVRTGVGGAKGTLGRVVRVRYRRHGTTRWPISVVSFAPGRADSNLYRMDGVMRLSVTEARELTEAINDAAADALRADTQEAPPAPFTPS